MDVGAEVAAEKPRESHQLTTRLMQHAQAMDAFSTRLFGICERLGIAVPPPTADQQEETVRENTFLAAIREQATAMERSANMIDHHLSTLEDFV